MSHVLQWLGLQCRHRHKSLPYSHKQTCTECGEVFEFTAYDLSESDKVRVEHYRVSETSIKRVGQSVLRFRQRKEQGKC